MEETKTGDGSKPKQKRDRSPAFPFISLKTAITRLVAFETTFGRHPTPARLSGNAWGMKGWTSQAQQTLAALKAFGFVEYKGSGTTLEASITEEGRTYLRAQQESIKKEVLKKAALTPKNLAVYFNLWGPDRPPDAVCLDHLVLKAGFTDAAAKLFLSVYDGTLAYAGLSENDKGGPEEAVSEDEELENRVQDPPAPPPLVNNPPRQANLRAKVASVDGGDLREVKFPLAEGDVTLFVPDGLSGDSVEDLASYLEVFLKKARREAKAENGGGNA